MPDSFGKRQRSRAKAQKATEKQEKRLARRQQKAERTGNESDWLADPFDPNDIGGPSSREPERTGPPVDESAGAPDRDEQSPQDRQP